MHVSTRICRRCEESRDSGTIDADGICQECPDFSTMGETFGEAKARMKSAIYEMARDRKAHWLTRFWATWTLVRFAASERRMHRAQRDFLSKLLGRKL